MFTYCSSENIKLWRNRISEFKNERPQNFNESFIQSLCYAEDVTSAKHTGSRNLRNFKSVFENKSGE